ncbi:zinc ribbon domain-containing protein [Granulicella tundricola]|uniref:Uncharacterized protein n=1 Tax=Granulicella tundricola (strain ATCC BAA-1859 / DSM 23138 / MP5ACTX9) TaxID=1198114 RepID=E8X406_GRATM|nr:zinc ribbon domain-containing protein [Granulicella tundricola]ADW70514.1 hypothetical protein AciX9_3509 [Granulicella tundricola MP5ACTX9]
MSTSQSGLQMVGTCHRCGGELAAHAVTDESGLFCPHCGAPQILLPEYMRPEPVPEPLAVTPTTGTIPPPLPQAIDWRNALICGGAVALVAAVLTVLGVISSFASLINFVWVVSGGVATVAVYQKRRPDALMNGRVGARIGLTAGLMLIVAIGLALATSGVVARFGLHRMASFDAQVAESVQTMQVQMQASMEEQKQSRDVQEKVIGMVNSPEVRAGIAVVYLGLLGAIVVLLGMGGGAFAGMLGARRQGVRRLL